MPISMTVLKRIAIIGGVSAIGGAGFISWRIPG